MAIGLATGVVAGAAAAAAGVAVGRAVACALLLRPALSAARLRLTSNDSVRGMARGRAKKARTLEKGSQRFAGCAYTAHMSRASASPTERPTARAPQPLEPPAGAELPGHRVRLAQLPGARRTQPHAAERRSDGCDAGGHACRWAAEREPVDASRRGHVPRAVRRQRVHHEPVRRSTNSSPSPQAPPQAHRHRACTQQHQPKPRPQAHRHPQPQPRPQPLPQHRAQPTPLSAYASAVAATSPRSRSCGSRRAATPTC